MEKTYVKNLQPSAAVEVFKDDKTVNYYKARFIARDQVFQLIGCSEYRIGQRLEVHSQSGAYRGIAVIEERYIEVKKQTSLVEK